MRRNDIANQLLIDCQLAVGKQLDDHLRQQILVRLADFDDRHRLRRERRAAR